MRIQKCKMPASQHGMATNPPFAGSLCVSLKRITLTKLMDVVVPSISTSTILAFGSESSICLSLFSPAAIVPIFPNRKPQPLTTLSQSTQFPRYVSLCMAASCSCRNTLHSNLNSETKVKQP